MFFRGSSPAIAMFVMASWFLRDVVDGQEGFGSAATAKALTTPTQR